MSNDLNSCSFIGRLGKAPDIRHTSSGEMVASFSIACGSSWTDKKTGDKKEQTEWINVSAFGKIGEICGKYLVKGAQVYISGKMKTEKWQDKEGKDRFTTKIIVSQMQMLGGGKARDAAGDEDTDQEAPKQQRGGGHPERAVDTAEFDDSSIPF